MPMTMPTRHCSLLRHRFLFLVFFPFLLRTQGMMPPAAKSSCRDHLLNGEGHSPEAVLPIRSPSGIVFWLLCRFPPPLSSQSARLSVQTIVHNAMEGQWWEEGKGEEVIRIGQQITDWRLLQSLLSAADECTQQVRIRWPLANQSSSAQSEQSSITSETFSGQTVIFRRNFTISAPFEQHFPVSSPPLLRLTSPIPSNSKISIRPLICRQMVHFCHFSPVTTIIPRPECHFELRSDSDRLRLQLDGLYKHSPRGFLNFVFRTGNPNGRLLELSTADGEMRGGVDLIDGYLLLINHIAHPTHLLVDGLWHSISLDLHSLSLRIDGKGAAISLLSAGSSAPSSLQWMDILVVGEVAELRILSAEGGRDEVGGEEEGRMCREGGDRFLSSLLHLRQQQSVPPSPHYRQPIFALSPVCEQKERNICNCKGPASALVRGRKTVECNAEVEPGNAFRLSRLSDRLAFFLIPKFGPRTPISVLLKSETASGLVLFGVYSSSSITHPSPTRGDLGGRVQVHFIDDTVFGAFCSFHSDGTERCYSCSIRRSTSFPSSDWVRFSLFHQQNLQFLTVDRQICLLSPNSEAVEAAELYRISETNVLFIGGAFYQHGAKLGQRVSQAFRRGFQDNTREKAPSLQGCIADIVVNGQRVDMERLLEAQIGRAQRSEGTKIFGISKGCAECPPKCKGAPCSFSSSRFDLSRLAECQCAVIYAKLDENGGCRTDVPSGIPLTKINQQNELPISAPIRAPRARRRIRLAKLWTLIQLPEHNSQLHTFLHIGGITVTVGENGRRVVVECGEFGIREEFEFEHRPDFRLHLLSLEITSTIGTTSPYLTLRLDNQIRQLNGFEGISVLLQSADSGQPEVQIHPLVVTEANVEEGNGIGGYIAELVFHYIPMDEDVSTNLPSGLSHLQVDFIPLLYDQSQLSTDNTNPANLLPIRSSSYCIRDPSLWTGNSSNWGRIGEFVGDGISAGRGIALFSRSSVLTRLSLLITTLLIVLILISLILYGIFVIRRHYRNEEHMGVNSDKHWDEKRPLNGTMISGDREEEEEYGRKGREEYGGFGEEHNRESKIGDQRWSNGQRRRMDRREEPKLEEIAQLEESPGKVGGGNRGRGGQHRQTPPTMADDNNNESFAFTPLRSQPLRRSPMTNSRSQFLASGNGMWRKGLVEPSPNSTAPFTSSPDSAVSSQGDAGRTTPMNLISSRQSTVNDNAKPIPAPMARKDEL